MMPVEGLSSNSSHRNGNAAASWRWLQELVLGKLSPVRSNKVEHHHYARGGTPCQASMPLSGSRQSVGRRRLHWMFRNNPLPVGRRPVILSEAKNLYLVCATLDARYRFSQYTMLRPI